MTQALLLSLFPAIGTLIAGLFALRARLSTQNLAFALHLGAGVVLGVVGVELMPRALEANPPVVILASFLGGAGLYVLLNWGADGLGRGLGGAGHGGVYALVVGVGIDMLTDGMMIAAGTEVGDGLGLLLGLGLLIADAPEAFATVATVRRDLSARVALLTALAFPALVLLGVPLGHFMLVGRPEVFEYIVLSATAGVLVLVVVEGLVPEAHALTRRQSGVAAMIFSIGFASFTALSLYLG